MFSSLQKLARVYDVELSYDDESKEPIEASEAQLRKHFRGRNIPCESVDQINANIAARKLEKHSRLIPPVHGVDLGQLFSIDVTLPSSMEAATYKIECEGTTVAQGAFGLPDDLAEISSGEKFKIFRISTAAPSEMSLDYWTLSVHAADGSELARCRTRIICAPNEFWKPTDRKIALTGLISTLNSDHPGYLGRGHLGSLEEALEVAVECGANMIATGPMALWDWPYDMTTGTPFMPLSLVLTTHHVLDVSALVKILALPETAAKLNESRFQKKFAELRKSTNVNAYEYDIVLLELLRSMKQEFDRLHSDASDEKRREFLTFIEKHKERMYWPALFCALRDHFFGPHPSSLLWDWRNWPEEYRDPNSDAVREFAASHENEIVFVYFLQWLFQLNLEKVLAKAATLGQQHDTNVGLMLNMPVGLASAAAETWYQQRLYFADLRNGAPPDELDRRGQAWGYPLQNPDELLEMGLEPLVAQLDMIGPAADAIEVDHGMRADRMWCYYLDPSATDEEKEWAASHGVYLRYPRDLILRVLSYMSHKHQFAVIPELVGTKSADIDEVMARWGSFSLTQHRFNCGANGAIVPSADIAEQCFFFGNSHNHFPEMAWVLGLDKVIEHRCGKPVNAAQEAADRANRDKNVTCFLNNLVTEGVLEESDRDRLFTIRESMRGADEDAYASIVSDPVFQRLNIATHKSRGSAKAQFIGIDIGEASLNPMAMNMPGVEDRYPSWIQRVTPTQLWKSSAVGDAIRVTREAMDRQ